LTKAWIILEIVVELNLVLMIVIVVFCGHSGVEFCTDDSGGHHIHLLFILLLRLPEPNKTLALILNRSEHENEKESRRTLDKCEFWFKIGKQPQIINRSNQQIFNDEIMKRNKMVKMI